MTNCQGFGKDSQVSEILHAKQTNQDFKNLETMLIMIWRINLKKDWEKFSIKFLRSPRIIMEGDKVLNHILNINFILEPTAF